MRSHIAVGVPVLAALAFITAALIAGGVYRGAAVRRGVAVGVGAAAVGAAAYGAYGAYGTRCGYYPNPPCY